MATPLDKDLVRESTIKVDGLELLVTICASQELKIKQKGKRTGEVKIGILELWEQLSGTTAKVEEEPRKGMSIIQREEEPTSKDNPSINLYDLRHLSAISVLDHPTRAKFDQILAELINQQKETARILRDSKKKK